MSEQKPVAWLNKEGVIVGHDEGGTAKPLYLHPAPQMHLGELAERLRGTIMEYEGRISLAEAVGVLEIVKSDLILNNAENL